MKVDGAKGIANNQFSERNIRDTGGRTRMANVEQKIRNLSLHHKKVQGLMHWVNEQTLLNAHVTQPWKKTVGVDGVRKIDYDRNVETNIRTLVDKMKQLQYRPQPVRRVYIPKINGKQRPLGIPFYEDRLVQQAMADVLNNVYEVRFLPCSCGFRPGSGAHDVLRKINREIMFGNVSYVLDADIKGFFDNVDHRWLMKFLEHDIQDKVFLRYIQRFLRAGVLEGTQKVESTLGTPQGGLISPVLANVYLHYVLDVWIEKVVRKKMIGNLHYVRFADDFLLLFQNETDAKRVMSVLGKRLKKFGLQLAEDKTRILPFGRWRGTKESFDFLGFTFYNTKSRRGKYRLGIRTSKKKLKSKRQMFKAWLRTRLIKPVNETMRLLSLAFRGHCNYYGISGNSKDVSSFHDYMKTRTYLMLKRRSQRTRITREKFNRIWKYYIMSPRIVVDIWSRRLFEELNAGKPHVQFCEGRM